MERAPHEVTSGGASGRAAEFEFARQEILNEGKELEELDAKIDPLRVRLRAGENVGEELMPLLDRRGELARAKEARERKS